MSEQVETVTAAEEPIKQNGTAAVIEVAETNEEKTESTTVQEDEVKCTEENAESSCTQEDEPETDEAKSTEEVPPAETVTVTETVLEIADTAILENGDTEPTYSQVVKVKTQMSQKSEDIKLDDYSVISMKEANVQVPPYTRRPENLNWEIQKTICFWFFLILFFVWLGGYYAYSQGLITIFDEKK